MPRRATIDSILYAFRALNPMRTQELEWAGTAAGRGLKR